MVPYVAVSRKGRISACFHAITHFSGEAEGRHERRTIAPYAPSRPPRSRWHHAGRRTRQMTGAGKPRRVGQRSSSFPAHLSARSRWLCGATLAHALIALLSPSGHRCCSGCARSPTRGHRGGNPLAALGRPCRFPPSVRRARCAAATAASRGRRGWRRRAFSPSKRANMIFFGRLQWLAFGIAAVRCAVLFPALRYGTRLSRAPAGGCLAPMRRLQRLCFLDAGIIVGESTLSF